MIRTAILGASGYVGGELLRLIAGHPELSAARLFGDSKAGHAVGEVHPHLAAAFPDAAIERFEESALDDVDLVFAALPHGHSQRIAGAILEPGVPFVDLGADFRLDDAATYERWYGEAHHAPELLGRFVYGIPELNRAAIRGSKAVAAAGCYATAAILALKPLVEAGLVKPDSIIVDAASGVSGAGRELKESTAFNTVDGSFAAYGLAQSPSHGRNGNGVGRNGAVHAPSRADDPRHSRHLLRRGDRAMPTRSRRCAPLMRTSRSSTSPPIRPRQNGSAGSNGARLTARYDERTGRVLAIAAIDNLGKGAAGQMIQCANLMLGLDETAGLTTIGVYP